jgi:hypothetical protein
MALETAEASPSLNHLQAKHRSYEAMLEALAQQPYLTEQRSSKRFASRNSNCT